MNSTAPINFHNITIMSGSSGSNQNNNIMSAGIFSGPGSHHTTTKNHRIAPPGTAGG